MATPQRNLTVSMEGAATPEKTQALKAKIAGLYAEGLATKEERDHIFGVLDGKKPDAHDDDLKEGELAEEEPGYGTMLAENMMPGSPQMYAVGKAAYDTVTGDRDFSDNLADNSREQSENLRKEREAHQGVDVGTSILGMLMPWNLFGKAFKAGNALKTGESVVMPILKRAATSGVVSGASSGERALAEGRPQDFVDDVRGGAAGGTIAGVAPLGGRLAIAGGGPANAVGDRYAKLAQTGEMFPEDEKKVDIPVGGGKTIPVPQSMLVSMMLGHAAPAASEALGGARSKIRDPDTPAGKAIGEYEKLEGAELRSIAGPKQPKIAEGLGPNPGERLAVDTAEKVIGENYEKDQKVHRESRAAAGVEADKPLAKSPMVRGDQADLTQRLEKARADVEKAGGNTRVIDDALERLRSETPRDGEYSYTLNDVDQLRKDLQENAHYESSGKTRASAAATRAATDVKDFLYRVGKKDGVEFERVYTAESEAIGAAKKRNRAIGLPKRNHIRPDDDPKHVEAIAGRLGRGVENEAAARTLDKYAGENVREVMPKLRGLDAYERLKLGGVPLAEALAAWKGAAIKKVAKGGAPILGRLDAAARDAQDAMKLVPPSLIVDEIQKARRPRDKQEEEEE